MLQESYNLNTSQLAEGVIEDGNKKFDSHYKFSCLDKFHIGVVASNLGWLDTAIGESPSSKILCIKTHIRQQQPNIRQEPGSRQAHTVL